MGVGRGPPERSRYERSKGYEKPSVFGHHRNKTSGDPAPYRNRGGMTQNEKNAHNNQVLKNSTIEKIMRDISGYRFNAQRLINKANEALANFNMNESQYINKIRKWNSLAAKNATAKGKANYYRKRLANLRKAEKNHAEAKNAYNKINQKMKEMRVNAEKKARELVNAQRAERNARRAVARGHAAANRQRQAKMPRPSVSTYNW
mgnify:FL=1